MNKDKKTKLRRMDKEDYTENNTYKMLINAETVQTVFNMCVKELERASANPVSVMISVIGQDGNGDKYSTCGFKNVTTVNLPMHVRNFLGSVRAIDDGISVEKLIDGLEKPEE